jgi:2-aminoadipate transaminase
MDIDIRYSSMASRLRRSEIRELLKLTRMPDTISFGGGLPDPAIFPYEAVEAASIRAIREKGRLALQYSPTEGEPFLKEQLSAFMARQGEKATPEEILVVASSQQALDLLSKILIDPGDPIIIERPCYVGTIQAFRAFGADFHGVATDQDGIVPEELEKTVIELMAAGRKPKFVYLIPDFQNPSGINLSLERRHRVLEIALKHNLLILEDSPYRELRFTGELLPSLRSLDKDSRVVQMKTFSKIFSPGFRLGWIVGPPDILDKLVMAKQGTDLCTSAFSSIMAGYLLMDGHVEKQIEISKQLYAKKARVMLEALDRYLSGIDGLSWSKPDGGMFLWVRLPEYMDAVEMINDAVELRVAYVIGTGFYYDGSGRNEMRLNYSYPTETQIEQGIERLSRIIRKRLRAPETTAVERMRR